MHTDHGLNLFASLNSFCQARIDEMSAAISATPKLVDFDAHTDILQLPDQDVLGLRGFRFAFNGQTVQVDVSIGVSTVADTNLFRQRSIMNYLANRLAPGTTIPVLDHTTGDPIGWMSVRKDVIVGSVINSKTRPYQQITLSLLTSETA